MNADAEPDASPLKVPHGHHSIIGVEDVARLAAQLEVSPPRALSEVYEENGNTSSGSPGLVLGSAPGHTASSEQSSRQSVEDAAGASDSSSTSGSARASSCPVTSQVWARGERQPNMQLPSITEEATSSPGHNSLDISTEGSHRNDLPSIMTDAADDIITEAIPMTQVRFKWHNV